MSVNQFKRKQSSGWIDVWWLYDDGGLTLLLPYILSTRKEWSECKLRIFTLAHKEDDLNKEQRNMAALLRKFRIDYANVIIIPDLSQPPSAASQEAFDKLISKWRLNETEQKENWRKSYSISDSEIIALQNKVR